MEYILADRKKAGEWGYSELGHVVRGNLICLNEKEVMNNEAMTGTLADRAEKLGGRVSSLSETKILLNQ